MCTILNKNILCTAGKETWSIFPSFNVVVIVSWKALKCNLALEMFLTDSVLNLTKEWFCLRKYSYFSIGFFYIRFIKLYLDSLCYVISRSGSEWIEIYIYTGMLILASLSLIMYGFCWRRGMNLLCNFLKYFYMS